MLNELKLLPIETRLQTIYLIKAINQMLSLPNKAKL